MSGYGLYLLTRLGQFALVVFIGINIAFVVTHATPIDPVEQSIAASTQFGSINPEAIEMMRQSLKELYGLQGGLWDQYVTFWRRIAVGDFGPSLSAFPTPVSTLIARALPWTVALLVVSTLLTWVLGNLLGGLAGYYRRNRALRFAGILAMAFHPIPYYIVAFLLLIVFGYLWPVLPISGGYTMNMEQDWSWEFILSLLRHGILPVASLALVGLGGWFMGMRSLVSNVVTEDYVAYAELAGVERSRILRSYVMRNALVPQVTGLAISLGSIFNGAIITEQVFGYPGVGTLLISAVHAGDYSLVLGITTVSILAVSFAVLLIDLAYPLLDPRVKAR
ncbi:MAG TPA: ABC transporter permease [Reyranella sp.]|jgi:peptide/nickel transport system permease protein|nr:ABC transporter permease [Reyranella sp.]